jgi:hypothetical protein
MWLRPTRILILVQCALACGADSEATCPPFPSREQAVLSVVETTATQLTRQGPVEVLLVEQGALYWYDERGAILKLVQGESQPVELRSAPGGFVGDLERASMDFGLTIDGFTSDTEHLYWGESSRYTGPDAGFVSGFSPPGRLLSIPKSGGQERLLLESPDRTLQPVVVETSRVIVRSSDGFHQLARDASQLEPIQAQPPVEASRVIGSQIYWTEPDGENSRLLRVGFDQVEPILVARIEGSDFEVGPGYVLWRQEQLQTEPRLVLEQNFVLLEHAEACTRSLPGLAESISFTTALDDQYVYWYSFNALGSVTDTSEGETPATLAPDMPLVRVSLKTGALQQLNTPGFTLSPGSQIVGHDAERVYVSTQQGLTAIQKP